MSLSKATISFVLMSLACCVVLTSGCGKETDDSKKNENKQPGPIAKQIPPSGPQENKGIPKGEFPPVAKGDLSLDSQVFAKDFKKYEGKRLQLTGKVSEVGRANGDTDFLILPPRIQCTTKMPEPWKKAWPGQTVKLVGTVAEFSERPGLYDCAILEVTGTKTTPIPAEQLAKDYSGDPMGTATKYAGKNLIISGPVAKVDVGAGGEAYVFFKTEAKGTVVFCHVNPFAKNLTDGLKPGQEITITGEFDKNRKSDNDVGLRLATVLERK